MGTLNRKVILYLHSAVLSVIDFVCVYNNSRMYVSLIFCSSGAIGLENRMRTKLNRMPTALNIPLYSF